MLKPQCWLLRVAAYPYVSTIFNLEGGVRVDVFMGTLRRGSECVRALFSFSTSTSTSSILYMAGLGDNDNRSWRDGRAGSARRDVGDRSPDKNKSRGRCRWKRPGRREYLRERITTRNSPAHQKTYLRMLWGTKQCTVVGSPCQATLLKISPRARLLEAQLALEAPSRTPRVASRYTHASSTEG